LENQHRSSQKASNPKVRGAPQESKKIATIAKQASAKG
jgi:hypothetical protein